MSEYKLEADWLDQAKLEGLVAEQHFNELLDIAVDVCFRDPDAYWQKVAELEKTQVGPEQPLVQQLGAWGLRAAVDIGRNNHSFRYGPRTDDKGNALLNPDTPITEPERCGYPLNPSIQHKIEAFGQHLMEEAFACLGDDAIERVQAYQSAETVDEQKAIVRWLGNRILALQRKGNATMNRTDRHSLFYLPVVISPKMIGEYPIINIAPSCLGVSILTASFFEKAGARHLHTGIAISNSEITRLGYAAAIGDYKQLAKEWSIPVPDRIGDKLRKDAKTNGEVVFEDRGYHAATLARYNNGDWVALDSNFLSLVNYDDDIPDRFDKIAEELTDIKQSSGVAVETMLEDFDGLVSTQTFWLRANRKSYQMPSLEEIDEYLTTVPSDLTIETIREMFITPALFKGPQQRRTVWSQIERRWRNKEYEPLNEYYYEKISEGIIKKYVFSDADTETGSLKKCLERCRTDSAYRSRRAEDLKMLPLLTALIMTGEYANAVVAHDIPMQHALFEIGLPAYRIGAAALSDCTVFLSESIPASFWATYWPSHIALTEHLPSPANSPATLNMLRNLIGSQIEASSLRYNKSHGIVSEFLGQT